MNNKRIDAIDYMKGFAILMVVVGHNYIHYTEEGMLHPICQMIYSFHMPFFFFLSGLLLPVTSKIHENGMKFFLIKKIQSLLLPWLFWSVVASFFIRNHYAESLTELFSDLNFYPNLGYWFLPVLFIFNLIYAVIERLKEKINWGGENYYYYHIYNCDSRTY